MITVVLLVILALTKDGEHPFALLQMPTGTTVAECEADHQVALDAMTDSNVIKIGYRCVAVQVMPTSGA